MVHPNETGLFAILPVPGGVNPDDITIKVKDLGNILHWEYPIPAEYLDPVTSSGTFKFEPGTIMHFVFGKVLENQYRSFKDNWPPVYSEDLFSLPFSCHQLFSIQMELLMRSVMCSKVVTLMPNGLFFT